MPRPLTDITFGFVINSQYSFPVLGNNNLVIPSPPLKKPVRKGSVSFIISKLPLMPGRYSIDLYFGSYGQNFDIIEGGLDLDVDPSDIIKTGRLPSNSGDVFWPVDWEITLNEWLTGSA